MAAQPEPRAPAVKQVPGILYSPLSGRARILGTGLEVWEIVRPYRIVGEDFEQLREWFDWLSEEQLRAALAFAEANPEFVEREIAEADSFRIEDLWEQHPETKPKHLR